MRLNLLAVLLLGAACAGIPGNLDRLPGSGATLVASVTMGYSGKFFERVSFYFRDERGRRFRLDSAVPWTIHPMLESTPDAGLEDENGRLYAIARPAGTYRLDAVQIHGDVPRQWARLAEPLTFSVAEGEVVYLGNLHVELCHLEGVGGPYYVAGGHPSVSDRSARDLPLLRAKFPALEGTTIQRRVLDGRALRAGTRVLYETCP